MLLNLCVFFLILLIFCYGRWRVLATESRKVQRRLLSLPYNIMSEGKYKVKFNVLYEYNYVFKTSMQRKT